MRIRFITSLLISLVFVLISLEYKNGHIGIIATLEKESLDWRLTRHTDTADKVDEIVIVDIDNDTILKFGDDSDLKLREYFSLLNDSLFDYYKVLVAGYTIPFKSVDNIYLDTIDQLNNQFREDGIPDYNSEKYVVSQLNQFRSRYDYDEIFRKSLENRLIVLGYNFDNSAPKGSLPFPVKFIDNQKKTNLAPKKIRKLTSNWDFYRGYAGNNKKFIEATDNLSGHINLAADKDGSVRRTPVFLRHGGNYYMSLPLAMLHAVRAKKSNQVFANVEENTIKSLTVGRHFIPINLDGTAYVKFKGKGESAVDFKTSKDAIFPHVSFIDVVEKKVDKKALQGKIVIISSSDASFRDLHTTPANPFLPRGQIMATQLINMLEDNNLYRPHEAQLYETILLIVGSLFLILLFTFTGPIISFLALAGGLVFITYFVLDAWDTKNQVWSLMPAIIAFSGLFIFNTIAGFFFELNSSRRLQSTFSQYVPAELAKRLASSTSEINMEGEERDLSILFSDVRDFTSISEKLTPKELIVFMNRMLTSLSEIIHKYDGTVDKYIGDCVMAFWNAPLHDEHHARNSILAAFEMQQQIKILSDEFSKLGYAEIRLGVGIATGKANVGNMGSTLRVAYTAMGDTVNIASRIEGITKYYRCSTLVSEETCNQSLDIFTFRAIDVIRVKGRSQPITIYEPWGNKHQITPEQLKQIGEFEAIRLLYQDAKFIDAKFLLDSYITNYPSDNVAQVYREKIEKLIINPPTEWDGITNFSEK